ncbi:MAG: PASTA domain-containing protein [Candidatus Acidiferrales bacterium]
MNFQERIQWIGRMALLLFVLCSAAFLSAITAMRLAIQGREVIVPDVTGQSLVDAQTKLQGRGLGMKIEDRTYNRLTIDAVVRQSPPSGMRVKVGQYEHVVLSLGPQEAKIPRVSAMSLRAARIELLRGGLQVGEVSNSYFGGAPVDDVLMQDPSPGATDATSSHVDLLVSQGARPAAYVTPDFQGSVLADAGAKITSAGLKIGKVSFAPESGVAHGIITGQTPLRGSRVDPSIPIDLEVAE